MTYRLTRFLIRLFYRMVTRVKVLGAEHIPASGGMVAVTNHVGRLDAGMPYCLIDRDDIIMLVAEKYREVAIFRWLAKALDGLWVDRFNADLAAVRMDEPVNYRMAERSWSMMKKLESWGVFFPQDKDGNYELLQVHPKGKFCLTMKEPELKTILARRLLDHGCQVFNRGMALELIVKNGRVAGAVGINIRTGERVVCHAGAVIVTSGGTARFGLHNNGYLYGVYDFPGNTGDGYAMAYRAGAALTGFEYTLNYYIIKDINAPLLYITLTRGAHLLTGMEEHLEKEHPSIKSMILEHRKDKSPLRIRMKHLPEDKIREIEVILFSTERPVQQRFFEGRGINFRTSDIELWPTEYYLCGGHGLTGIFVNEKEHIYLFLQMPFL